MSKEITDAIFLIGKIAGLVLTVKKWMAVRSKGAKNRKLLQAIFYYVLPLVIVLLFLLILCQLLAGSHGYELIVTNWRQIFKGFLVTIGVSLLSILWGTIMGVTVSLILVKEQGNQFMQLLNAILRGVIYILLSLPALILLYMAHYSNLIGSIFWASVFALSINLFPFVAKIVTASINNISQDQLDAAKAFGYTGNQINRHFKISFVVRSSLQSLLVEYYTTIKLSSLAGAIGLVEAFHVSQDIIRDTQDPISGYIILSICYFILVSPIALYADYRQLKWRSVNK